jgi:hypothetical protein
VTSSKRKRTQYEARQGLKPWFGRADAGEMTLEALQAELKALLASWEYAYAMGHGCSVGDHPQHRAVRRRVEVLRARIAEHTA